MKSRGRVSLTLMMALLVVLTACDGDADKWNARSIRGLMPDLAFSLTDENGRPVNEADFRGKTVMVFFGFTHCPGYCPTTLSSLAQALRALPDAVRQDFRVLFVSVDPGRDGPAGLKRYTANFSPSVIGLTGSMENLKDLAKRYRTTFSYGERDGQGNYTVSHGRAVYVFDDQGRARLMIVDTGDPSAIAQDLRRLAVKAIDSY